jgi:EmrB/QacA subfamily drug resistance transporter
MQSTVVADATQAARTTTVTARAEARAKLALGVASGAAFLAMLDATVANLAVADLHRDFPDVAVGDLSWVVTIYAIAFAALLAPGGRIADVIGRRALLMAGAATFTTMSLVAAVAPSLGVLLVARFLQGAGAAVMIPASLAVVLADTPPERRAAAIGAWSGAGALAAAAGPAIGGVLVDVAGWRSVFYVNLPAGLALIAGARLLAHPGVRPRVAPPDALGTALLAVGVGLAALGVSRGAEWGWTDARTLAAIVAGVIAVGACLVRSRSHPAPAVEVGLWRASGFARANLASLLYGGALFALLLVGVLFTTQVWGYSPLEAGLAVTPGAVVAAAVAVAGSRAVQCSGPWPPAVLGLLVLGADCAWIGLAIEDDPAFWTLWLPAGLILGAAMGAITTALSSAAALSVPPERFAAGVGLNQAARAVGGALGVAALSTILLDADPHAADSYRGVYALCVILTVAAAAVAATAARGVAR